ncbi:MAG: hypothetical protein ILP10_06565, partial [Lachnospiraceae bacterium]|nr:hypothetical protein [Lachnospiraceae bacterium]
PGITEEADGERPAETGDAPEITEGADEKPSTVPDPPEFTWDTDVQEVFELGALHGLSKEDIRSEYNLFKAFSEKIEGNDGLKKYKDIVYRIFPVIAENRAYIDCDLLLERLGDLQFNECELEVGEHGIYHDPECVIDISTNNDENTLFKVPATVFHELMHFVDFSAGKKAGSAFLLEGKPISLEEFLNLSSTDMQKAIPCYNADYIVEGGAELFTAKYFSGAINSYPDIAQFLTGIEHIYGTERLSELFLSPMSDALIAKMFYDAGYSQEEFEAVHDTLNRLTYPEMYDEPAEYVSLADMLIDLYEAELGDGWKTDDYFLYILKAINSIGGEDYKSSKRADFLKDVMFKTWEEHDEFVNKLYSGFPSMPELTIMPPTPVIRDGRKTIGEYAIWKDEDGKEIRGSISAEYDFVTGKPTGYETIDMLEIARGLAD